MNRPALILAVAMVIAMPMATASSETLTIGTRTETTSIDPHFYSWVPNSNIDLHFFDHIVMLDEDQQVKPRLAVSWKPIDDKSWEFKLRKGVKFHDGTPFTADDIAFTVKRAPSLKRASPAGNFVRDKKITVIDDYTFHVTSGRPNPLMPRELAVTGVLSRKHGEGATTEDYNTGKATIGTGAYKFVEWVKGDRVVLKRNEDFWGEKPIWDTIIYKPVLTDPVRVATILGGEVDMIDFVPTTDVAMVRGAKGVQVIKRAGMRVIYLQPDTGRDISPFVKNNDGTPMRPNALRSWKVRRALSLAINRDAIIERVMEGSAVKAAQLAPPGMFARNPDIKQIPFDAEQAKQLLAEAGYPDGFRLTLHAPNDRYINDAKIAETVAAMWTKVGVKTEVVTMPKAVYFARALRGGELGLSGFSVTMAGFASETGETSAPYRGMLHTRIDPLNLGHFNVGRFSNIRADTYLDMALQELDNAKRETLLQQAAEVYMGDYALWPLHFQVNVWALREGLDYVPRMDNATLGMFVTKKAK